MEIEQTSVLEITKKNNMNNFLKNINIYLSDIFN